MSEPTIEELAKRYPEIDAFRDRMLREMYEAGWTDYTEEARS